MSDEDREYVVVDGIAMMLVIEAINSCAIEHAEDCTCVVCRAADGDLLALTEVIMAINEAATRR